MGCFGMWHVLQNVFQTAFWVLLVAGVVTFVRRSRAGMPRRRRAPDAIGRSMSTLNERYARGEIDRDEYLERKAYLE